MSSKLKLAVWKFASCDGCQLSILDCEDELLYVTERVEIAYFPEATKTMLPGPYDVSLVEGSITTEHDEERIKKIREESGLLITIGACATSGGIQALRNFENVDDYISRVYAHPEYIKTLAKSHPVEDYVKVDYQLRGCPVNKYQLLEVLTAFAIGKKPNIPDTSVCIECKLNGTICLPVLRNEVCLGPLTHAGCGALCPSYNRGCFGCYGPKEAANPEALSRHFLENGKDKEEMIRFFRNFNSGSEIFADHSIKLQENE